MIKKVVTNVSIETKIKKMKADYKDIMDDIKKALDTSSDIEYKVKGKKEIKAQASRKKITEIVCQLPNIKKEDISIILDIVETKKATYIRLKV